MDLKDFLKDDLVNGNGGNSELALCWDLCAVDNFLLIEERSRIAYYLQYSRAATHFVSYINAAECSNLSTSISYKRIVASLFESLICMSKVAGISSGDVKLKAYFDYTRENKKDLPLTGITINMWHTLTAGEILTPWFNPEQAENCDWQGIRNNLFSLFSLLAVLCSQIDVDYEELCSCFVRKHKNIE